VPTDDGYGTTSDENIRYYFKHCYPAIRQIVQKVTRVRVESEQPLTHIYIITNSPVTWADELKVALGKSGDWDQIKSSRDLDLNWEQKFVAQALDMIGNGVRAAPCLPERD